ncbi:hypothetical protein FHS85_000932 [Rhodoligotrophos appendicifer]|nr:hypothetical protein [Rhodoligotrophos appendicifer]
MSRLIAALKTFLALNPPQHVSAQAPSWDHIETRYRYSEAG